MNELLITPVNQWNSEIISFIKGAGFLHGLWFLKCLFFYYIICWLSLRYLKKEWLAVSVTMIVVLLLSDVNFSSKMLPFFWAGYFFMKYRSFIEKHQYKIGGIALLTMCILWFFWIPKYTYVGSGKGFIAYSMRTLMGITSSICWILLFKQLSKLPSVNQSSIFKWLLKAGTCTLGIYCCHAIFYEPIRGSWGLI